MTGNVHPLAVRSVMAGAAVLTLAALTAFQSPHATEPRSNDDVTWAKHVAPIIQEKCQVCHRPGSIAPMSLLSYDDVKQFAPLIRERVTKRIMPPWHIDKTIGIQEFKNDRSLTEDQIRTIVSWIDAGMPFGDEADLPPPKTFPDGDRWELPAQFGEPELVLRSPPYTLAPRTQDKWFRPVSETGVTEPRWVRAIEIRPVGPNGRRTIHHVLTVLEQQEEGITGLASTAHHAQPSAGLFMEWAVGKTGEIFPEDAGKLMLPGSRIRWEVHMFAIGEEVKDNQAELAVYFYPKGYTPKNRTVLRMFDMRGAGDLDIPPGRITVTQDHHVLTAPARLENFQPHMHMRGKAMQMEAIYPDGRKEVLSRVSNFQWRWHVNYVYANDAAPLLPKGTVLVFTAWHDNTADNPNNPDPNQWVGWGDRTVDEMAHAWVDVTYLEQADFERLVEERKKKTATESSARK
ncbi:MAG: hypothetical protein L0271_12075 [Gemmatimonadetes bacterium]|nr:hypothetical protein [Gemmatimonadota bacterium]